MGKTRGRQQTLGDGDYSKEAGSKNWSDSVLNIQASVFKSNQVLILTYFKK